jgi:hypothetical protein
MSSGRSAFAAPKEESMRTQGSTGLRLRDVLEQLTSEGWVVRPHHIQYALRASVIDPPKKSGGWHRYTERHVDGLRRYLAERSRSQDGRASR